MPELPEVETTRRGIEPLILDRVITTVHVRQRQLRWAVPPSITEAVGHAVTSVGRRAKYLILGTGAGSVILHLGMSGSLRVLPAGVPPQLHDHVDLVFANRACLRLRDPRRFGAVLWTRGDPLRHRLLAGLGPEPFDPVFDGAYLYRLARGRRVAVKSFIMNSAVVVGVGNIYASESLFAAGINPRRAAGRISRRRYERLAEAVRDVLGTAIRFGGTTLKDFTNASGKPGYFRHELQVYGRPGEPCPRCGEPLHQSTIGQRSTFFCRACQS